MALSMIIESMEDVDEPLRELYVERDGKFELDVTGVFSTLDRDKLRGSLQAERTAHKQTRDKLSVFGERTPESIEELETGLEEATTQIEALKKDGGPTEEDTDKMVERRALARIKPIERQFAALQTKFDALTGDHNSSLAELSQGKIQGAVRNAAAEKSLGIVSDARDDIGLWAERTFEVDESGEVVSRDGVSGVTPGLLPADVFKEMKDGGVRRHWFGQTVSANATGGKGGAAEQGDNPFMLVNGRAKNLTAAAQIVKSDPARAKKLAIAGKSQHLFRSLFSAEELEAA